MTGRRELPRPGFGSHVWVRTMRTRNFGEIADWFTTFFIGTGVACLLAFDVAAGWGWHGSQALLVAAFGLLIAAASGAVGWVAGLLFGIPRALARPQSVYYTSSLGTSPQLGGQPGAEAGAGHADGPQQGAGPVPTTRVNTNLEDISDWLTKTIIGVVLTQLFWIPSSLWRFAGRLNDGGPGWKGHGQSFVLLLLVYFGVGGFWLGYVGTRTILTKLFEAVDAPGSDSDQDSPTAEENVLGAALKDASVEGTRRAIDLGEALLRGSPGAGSAGLHVLLARAYGRQHRLEGGPGGDAASLESTRLNVVKEVRAALSADPGARDTLRDLWRPSGKGQAGDLDSLAPADPDLSALLGM